MDQCPSCHLPVLDDAKECSRCGILFAKWREREANVEAGDLTRYQRIDRATSSEFNWTVLILFCCAVLGVLYYFGQRAIQEDSSADMIPVTVPRSH